ncbi:MAG: DUF4145 domain-containing protein [bacterium]
MSNFVFLKKNNKNLFNIIAEAEKLFRDEYFEQAVIQTRRFAENICRDLLQDKVLPDETFDSMINRIKDKSFDNMRIKEFTDDLYFLKKHGNNSAHSSVAIKNGKTALECLERAYEIAVFYSNAKYGYSKKLDKSIFSEEVLMTGNTSSPKLLKEKYSTELKKMRKTPSTEKKKINSKKATKKSKNISDKKIFSFNTIIISVLIFIALVSLYMYIKSLI